MADEDKTEEATPKKIEDARKKGNVPRSMDTTGFVVLVIGLTVLFFAFKFIFHTVENLYRYYISFIGKEITKETLIEIFLISIKEFFIVLAPISLSIVIAAILGNVAQFGFLFTTEPLKPKFEKINPIKGLKRLFSLDKLIEGAKITFKVFFILLVGAIVYYGIFKQMPYLESMDLIVQLNWLEKELLYFVSFILLIIFLFAMIDLVYSRHKYKKSLRMTKQEVKDEYKNQEGNPEVKARIRKIMVEMASKRMMSNVPQADVVVTNPTHYAVALKYDKTKAAAPIVVAKGIDHLALQIKKIARENDIMIVENPPLARELYKLTDVDEVIPEKLYKAVAEVLAFVYKAKKL